MIGIENTPQIVQVGINNSVDYRSSASRPFDDGPTFKSFIHGVPGNLLCFIEPLLPTQRLKTVSVVSQNKISIKTNNISKIFPGKLSFVENQILIFYVFKNNLGIINIDQR